MATPVETKIFDNKTLTAAATADSNLVYCKGARAVHFRFTSSGGATEVFAAGSAFQILLRTTDNETILAPATPSKQGVTVVNATDLNGAKASDGIIITVVPSSAQAPYFAIKEIGVRVVAGAVNMTDIDCTALVFN